MRLVIVESPKKAKTIQGILGREYRVEASYGHVRDLPPKRLGVSLDGGFEPEWEPVPKARQRVAALRKAAAGAESVVLATDPDREGEAIAWHVASMLGARAVTRVVFHAITPGAVRAAFQSPRAIDRRLVEAQQARRVLDRLVGYQVSPLLWRKIAKGTSAGRVQSVALRLLVDREREIRAFEPTEFWTIDARVHPEGRPAASFLARLIEVDGKKAEIPDKMHADALLAELERASYRVASHARNPVRKTPPPPFTTSTMQQAAAGRLRMSGKRTMQVAQSLYEAGLITYHRTDAVRVEPEAVVAVRKVIAAQFGDAYLPDKPRAYANRIKNAQEAHEAIRPVDPARLPSGTGDEAALYRLIWQRFTASQMAAARYDHRTIDVAAGRCRLRGESSTLVFPGYLAVYRDDDEETEPPLPEVREGEPLELEELVPTQRFTSPPDRYTEAALVKELERAGVGRPSTYATIVGTIVDRGYVAREGRVFVPTELGFAVNDFVVSFFPTVADVGFTAEMEEGLDAVARGERGWQELLGEFYRPFRGALEVAGRAAVTKVDVPERPPRGRGGAGAKSRSPASPGSGSSRRVGAAPRRPRAPRPPDPLTKRVLTKGAKRPTPDKPVGEVCPLCGKPMVKRSGQYGEFLGCSAYPACRGTINLERGKTRSPARRRARTPRAPRAAPAARRRPRS